VHKKFDKGQRAPMAIYGFDWLTWVAIRKSNEEGWKQGNV